MTENKRVAEEVVSAGGLVYRVRKANVEVVICRLRASSFWGLPKGTPEPGETREQTAIREVSEETGLEVRTERLIDSIDYWFVTPRSGVRYHKTVFFYLMIPTGGDLSRHDHEFEEVRWFAADEALGALKYDNEVRVLEKGLSLVSEKA